MWGGPLLCPAVVWGVFFQTFPLPFPLLKFFFTLLVSFIWNSQKCPISQNIWCLIKTQLKNSIQTIFHGVVHEQPWSSIVCLLWGVHYCVQLLPEALFLKHSFTFSFAKVVFCFLSFFNWNSQKCPISQNTWCLIETQFKNSIHCAQVLPEVIFFKHSLYLFLC